MTNPTCSRCQFVLKEPGPKGQPIYYCRRFPPSAFPMFAPHKITGQPVLAQQTSLFPLVQEHWQCGEWKFRAMVEAEGNA